MEQTAVEKMIQYFIEQKDNGASHWCINDLIAQLYQAKAMEKEQKIQFATEYSNHILNHGLLTPTEFFKQNFKSK